MSISISSSTLFAYYQAREGITDTSTAGTAPTVTAPIAPWKSTTTSSTSTASTQQATNSLVAKLLEGNSIVNPATTTLSTTTSNADANTDYKNLFALYQGLSSLESLATAASQSGISTAELHQLQSAFDTGLGQVRGFIGSSPFQEFQVSNGKLATSAETTTGAQQSSDTYTSQPLVTGSSDTVVPAFQGDVAFSLTSTSLRGQATTVNFNLDDLGSTPRTLSNVVTYLNGQLKAAGLTTRFGVDTIPGAPASSQTVNGATLTTPAQPDQYVLQINGTPNETLSFSAASTTPAVYVAQTSTDPTATSSSAATTTTTTSTTTSLAALTATSSTTATATPTTTSQLVKLDTPASNGGATTRGFTGTLPDGATLVSTAAAPDGSVYVLANVTAPINGQAIQGQQDAALLKYDSAGNLVYTRTLGAADTATGEALAVSADGSQVAIAGSITGSTLDPTDTSQKGSTTAQSFVQVYDSSGEALWDNVQDATADNQVNAVAFGANNSVYVAGQTLGRLPGTVPSGAQDAYIQGFNATSTTDKITGETTWTAKSAFTTEYGTSGVDRATGLAVDGASVYVSSVENGDAVVRRYDLAAKGPPALGAEQDLGALSGGAVTGLAIASDGSVLVAGSTHDANLQAGTITSAYSGDGDAFVASLNSNLDSGGSESLAYYNGGAPTTVGALTVSGNTAYIAGQLAGPTKTSGSTGFAAAIDPTVSGGPSWSTTFSGNNGSSDPVGVAVANTGASVLDLLGLPQGQVLQQQQPSQLVTANTSARPGDQFFIQTAGGAPTAVTVAADDTYQTLAHKIAIASNYQLNATTITIDGQQQIRLAPANGADQVRVEAGAAGQDALSALGLKEGLLSTTTTSASTSSASTVKTANGSTAATQLKGEYAVTVPSTLALGSSADIAAAQQALAVAVAEVKSIYTDMTTPKSTSSASGGTVPAYITNQISNYTLALQRLTGGSSSGGSSAAALSLLAH